MNRFVLAASAAVVCGMSVSMSGAAVLPVPVNNWQMLYDAHSLPNAANSVWLPRQSTSSAVTQFTQPTWAAYGTASISDIGGGDDVFTLNTMGTGGSNFYTLNSDQSPYFNPTPSTGYTFETRAKIMAVSNTGPTAAAEFDFDDGGDTQFWKLILFQNAGGQYQALLADLAGTGLTVNIDNTQFHTYRVAVQGSTGTFYVDGANMGTISTFTAGVGTKTLRFGDLTGADAEMQVDYIRMNDTGAIAVPEPMSLSALAAAGLLMMRRRGRRSC